MKPKSTKPPRSKKLKTMLVLVIVLLLVGGGTLLYRQHQKTEAIAQERAQFDKSEEDLNNASSQVTQKVGIPDDQKKVKECDYTSDTFELDPHGDLFCHVAIYLIYSANNFEEAKALAINIESSISQTPLVVSTLIGVNNNDALPVKVGSHSYTDEKLSCFRSYTYVGPNELNGRVGYPKLSLKSTQGLLVQNECGSQNPKTQHYPLATN